MGSKKISGKKSSTKGKSKPAAKKIAKPKPKAPQLKLYSLEPSGNCYKARLLLALLKQPYELIEVDFMGGQHKTPEFLKMNPRGQIPILVDGDTTLFDSHAILVYLARKAKNTQWLPTDALGCAKVMQWLSFSANEIQNGVCTTRLIKFFGMDFNYEVAAARARHALQLLEAHLTGRKWLELNRPTIADIAVLPYVSVAREGGLSLDPNPNIRNWIGRIKALPRFVPMPGMI